MQPGGQTCLFLKVQLNLITIVVIALVLLILILFLIFRNKKDEKEFEEQFKQDYHKPKAGDVETEGEDSV